MGHVQITITKLITWARIGSENFAPTTGLRADWNALLTLSCQLFAVCLFEYLFAILIWRSINSCQTRVSADHHYLTVSRAHFSIHWGHIYIYFLSFPLIFYLITGNSYQACLLMHTLGLFEWSKWLKEYIYCHLKGWPCQGYVFVILQIIWRGNYWLQWAGRKLNLTNR